MAKLPDIQRPVRCFSPEILKQARQRAGLSQQALADRAGMARTNYVNLETGARLPGRATLRRLATACGVSSQQLSGIQASQATLRDLREWANLSQAETAAQGDWRSTTSYTQIERGLVTLTPEQAGTLAQLFGVTPRLVIKAAKCSRHADQ